MPLSLVTAPTAEPLSVEDLRTHVLQGLDVDDAYLGAFVIPAARDRAEAATNRALCPQTWDYYIDRFPPEPYIEVPKPPLTAVTYIKYRDQSGTLQTLSTDVYLVDMPAGPRCRRGRIGLKFAQRWPVTYGQVGDVVIRFTCGYAKPEDVPPLLRWAQLLDCGSMYANREDVVRGSRLVMLEIPNTAKRIYGLFKSRPTQAVGGNWRG